MVSASWGCPDCSVGSTGRYELPCRPLRQEMDSLLIRLMENSVNGFEETEKDFTIRGRCVIITYCSIHRGVSDAAKRVRLQARKRGR